jgi:hypothetical protein
VKWICRDHGPLKCWYPTTSLHSITTQTDHNLNVLGICVPSVLHHKQSHVREQRRKLCLFEEILRCTDVVWCPCHCRLALVTSILLFLQCHHTEFTIGCSKRNAIQP